MNENSRFLRRRFADRLIERAPETVLDVGTGRGEFLGFLRDAGIEAKGIDASADRVEAAVGEGLDCALGDAEELPFEDGSFDWVTILHALHHMRDPYRALFEAARVARTGLVLADPWRDLELPEQRTARKLDTWLRRQDTRLGHVHHADHTPARMVRMLPAGLAWKTQFEFVLRPELVPMEAIEKDFEFGLNGLADDDPDRALVPELRAEAERTGVGRTGTAIAVLTKDGGSPHLLAQANIARMRAPIDDPLMAGFTSQLDPINALADRTPGFVWRLQSDDGDATAIRAYDDERILFNMSVWRSLDALHEYVFTGEHAPPLKNRGEWFERMDEPHSVLWWVEPGHTPTIDEAKEKLALLGERGPSADAFTFQKLFEPARS